MSETLEELRKRVERLKSIYEEPRESLPHMVRRFGLHKASKPSGYPWTYRDFIEEYEEAGDPTVEEEVAEKFIRRLMRAHWSKEAAGKKLMEILRKHREEE